MLGRFLEYSFAVDEIGPALQFYRSLGFQDLPTGDFIDKRYAAVWDGHVVLGLLESDEPATLRFVRPSLREHMPVFRRLKIEIAAAELGDDEFNRISFLDNAGHAVELVEARTHSMAERDPTRVAACGRFAEISLPTHSIGESIDFWSALGLTAGVVHEAPYPHVRLEGDGCAIGFHQANFMPGPSFVAPDFSARSAFLRARQLRLSAAASPQLGAGESLRLAAPSGPPVYLHAG